MERETNAKQEATIMAEATEKHGEETVKLFVGQVPKHMTESQLLELFRESALVVEVNIIKDKVTRAPRGCCFVICPSREEADKAVDAYHNKKTLPGASSPLQVKYADGELERLEHKLFVGMLPKDVPEGEVLSLFSNYGTVKDLRVLRGSQHTSKGCAFLKYESKEQAVAALESLNGKHKMEGSNIPLVVKWADTEKERQARRLQKPYHHGPGSIYANSQNPSLFGALGMSYFPPYNGYGYHAPGSYGYMQYRPPQMQNMVSSPMQGKTMRGVSSESMAPRNFPVSYMGSGYRSVPGIQYPMAYPRGMPSPRPMNGSYDSVSPATSSGFSTSPGPQAEGPPGANLFIYNIPQEYGDQELSNAFQPFGMVLSAKVFMDKATGVSKCFGFVSFDSPAAAQSATSVMNGRQLGGKKLKVQPKRDNKQGGPETR